MALDLHRADCEHISCGSGGLDEATGSAEEEEQVSELRVCSICQSLIYKGGFEAHLKLHESSLKVSIRFLTRIRRKCVSMYLQIISAIRSYKVPQLSSGTANVVSAE